MVSKGIMYIERVSLYGSICEFGTFWECSLDTKYVEFHRFFVEFINMYLTSRTENCVLTPPGQKRCYSVDFSSVGDYVTHELSYNGSFPIYNGESISVDDIAGIEDHDDCIFKKMQWICDIDGGVAVPDSTEMCSDSCESLLNPPNAVGFYYNDIVMSGAYDLKKVGDYLLVTARTAETLSVIDVSDPRDPVLAAVLQLQDEPYRIVVEPMQQVAYLGIINDNGIVSVNITDITHPVVISTTTSGSQLDGPRSLDFVYPKDGRTILIVAAASDDEWSAFDVSDPADMVFVSSLSTLDAAWGVKSLGNGIVWVSATNTNAIAFLNASDPENMVRLSVLTSDTYYDNALSFVENPGTNIGYVQGSGDDKLSAIDYSDLTAPVNVAQVNTGDLPIDIIKVGSSPYLIVLIGDTDDGLEAYDISDPTDMKLIYQYRNVAAMEGSRFMIYEGRYLYATHYSSNGITVTQLC